MRVLKPSSITQPASRYAQGVAVPADANRVIVSGQCGVTPDGDILEGTAAQMRQAFSNVIAVVEEGGLGVTDIAKVCVFLTQAEDVALYRDIRDEMLGGHVCASTLLIVSALAHPEWTVEIEAEATASR